MLVPLLKGQSMQAVAGSLGAVVLGVALVIGGCASQRCEVSESRRVEAEQAFGNYIAAINSNDLDRLLAMFTDDVVFLTPNAPPIVGKAAVREWCAGYFDAFSTHWDKRSLEFEIAGDWAFERYSYTSTDTPRGGGEPIVGTGWGMLIYRREADGVWRVARDAVGPDRAPPGG
ncbi:MAG: nuclear transport factor 2 family protein [Phycisphaeraceae bacterium]|nr:nuclear transport factor 2 family protein [Phycisphaeraceae bacterium]